MPLWSIHCCTLKISKHVGEVIGWNTITKGGVTINLSKQLSNILMLDEKTVYLLHEMAGSLYAKSCALLSEFAIGRILVIVLLLKWLITNTWSRRTDCLVGATAVCISPCSMSNWRKASSTRLSCIIPVAVHCILGRLKSPVTIILSKRVAGVPICSHVCNVSSKVAHGAL